jgi:hypothetical protein
MNAKITSSHQPWNKGKLVGQKSALRLRDIWRMRIRLELAQDVKDLALFDLAIDSKLRACDLTRLPVGDVAHGNHVVGRAMVMQQKTKRPVQFEITPQGNMKIILDDDNGSAEGKALLAAFAEDKATADLMLACGGKIAPWFASITFGGADLSTVYIGTLRGDRIPYFTSPVAGLPMVHW